MKVVEKAFSQETSFPEFNSGDTITVHYKIKEGNKERIQQYQRYCNSEKRTRYYPYIYCS